MGVKHRWMRILPENRILLCSSELLGIKEEKKGTHFYRNEWKKGKRMDGSTCLKALIGYRFYWTYFANAINKWSNAGAFEEIHSIQILFIPVTNQSQPQDDCPNPPPAQMRRAAAAVQMKTHIRKAVWQENIIAVALVTCCMLLDCHITPPPTPHFHFHSPSNWLSIFIWSQTINSKLFTKHCEMFPH